MSSPVTSYSASLHTPSLSLSLSLPLSLSLVTEIFLVVGALC